VVNRDIETQVAEDGVATLALARPELEDWTADPAVRVVVLTGAGPTFCAGFDLNEFAEAELAQQIKDSSRRYNSPCGISPSHWWPP
jgi:enoyl-CoA hydratase/carnithine racemase